jgi:PAS domain S-box-containing protein
MLAPLSTVSRRARTFAVLVLLTQAVLLALDVTTGTDVVLTTAYLTGPLALALVLPPRLVAIAAAVSLALALASGAWNDFFLATDHIVRCTLVAAAGTLAVLSARTREEAVQARAQTEAARRRAEATRRRLDAVLGALAEAVTVHDLRGKTIYANDAAVRLLGAASVEEVLASEPGQLAARFAISYEDGSPVNVEDLPGRRAVLGEPAPALLTRSIERRTGRSMWLLTKATVVEDDDADLLAVNVIEDVTASKESEIRQRYLADVGRALGFSLEPDAALERIARLTVPTLADWCAVDLVDEEGELRRVALVHSDPDRVTEAASVSDGGPDPTLRELVRGGRPAQLFADIDDALLDELVLDPARRAAVRALGLRSAILAPMRVGEHALGVLTLVHAESGRSFREEDLPFVQDLALRVAVAVDNARLSSERAQTAATLQRSLLPERLPEVPGVRTAAAYRPGERGSEVGGDFYDIFDVDGGTLVLLGDVTGKGVQAAALTALVRHTARTAARFDPRPAAVLALVNEVLREQPALALVSVACARLVEDGGGLVAELACGGHPLPLRLGGDGTVQAVGRGGVLLGAVAGGHWPQTRVRLQPGQTLLFYTDGATDVPGDAGRFGDERLAVVAAGGSADPEVVVARVDRALEDYRRGRVTDDRALLAVQCVGAPLPARPR